MTGEFEDSLDDVNEVVFDVFVNCHAVFTVVVDDTPVDGLLEKNYEVDLNISGNAYTFSYDKNLFPVPVIGMTVNTGTQLFDVFDYEDHLTGEVKLQLKFKSP